MKVFLFNFVLFAAAFAAVYSAARLPAGHFGRSGRGKGCAQRDAAILFRATGDSRAAAKGFAIAHRCDGGEDEAAPSAEHAEGASAFRPVSARTPIRCDSRGPERVAVAEDRPTEKTAQARKRRLILLLALICLAAWAIPRMLGTATTVGQLSDEIKAVADQTPTALVYTESIGAPGTFAFSTDDPAIAREALDVILSAAVDRRVCQMDMYRLQYEEYRFDFGADSCTFRFVPGSYFCHDGQYYELGENRLNEVRDLLHDMAAETQAAMEPQP